MSAATGGSALETANTALDDVMTWLGFADRDYAKYMTALVRERRAIFKRARP